LQPPTPLALSKVPLRQCFAQDLGKGDRMLLEALTESAKASFFVLDVRLGYG